MTILDPLFRELSDGVCVSDAQGNILYINPAAQRMLDLEGDDKKVKICEHPFRVLQNVIGNGLGLESTLGRGSEFIVRLPAISAPVRELLQTR